MNCKQHGSEVLKNKNIGTTTRCRFPVASGLQMLSCLMEQARAADVGRHLGK